MSKADVLIPALNEAKTLRSILVTLHEHPYIDKIIVINDGSTDDTELVVMDYIALTKSDRIQIINQPNQGKAAAVRAGLYHVDSSTVLLLDGDLLGLTAEHISELIDPVLDHELDMTVGRFAFLSGRFWTDLAHVFYPSLSGQRAIRLSCIQHIQSKVRGFELEPYLNSLARKNAWRWRYVSLVGLSHRMKPEKMGFWQGWCARLKMWREVSS
jgi:glycosyltransferase involved in cell wall biosynthesis